MATRSRLPSGSTRWHSRPASPSRPETPVPGRQPAVRPRRREAARPPRPSSRTLDEWTRAEPRVRECATVLRAKVLCARIRSHRLGSTNAHLRDCAPVAEAPVRMTKNGLVVEGEGWFVVNARKSRPCMRPLIRPSRTRRPGRSSRAPGSSSTSVGGSTRGDRRLVQRS